MYFLKANDVADEGVLVHARDNSDLDWVTWLFACGTDQYMWHRGYDYYLLGLHGQTDKTTGAWCGERVTYSAYFICEGIQL